MRDYLLAIGLVFPLLSWLTWIVTRIESSVKKKRVSSISIPIIGPVLLTSWILLDNQPKWLIPPRMAFRSWYSHVSLGNNGEKEIADSSLQPFYFCGLHKEFPVQTSVLNRL